MTTPNIRRLVEILSLKRAHGSVGERKFVEQILTPALKPYTMLTFDSKEAKQTGFVKHTSGEVLAYAVSINNPDGTFSPILWTSHIDTVHSANEDSRQMVIYDEPTQMIYKQDGKPLGADDGAGVWLMLEMIEARVPGTYMFFRGEECGGIGSSGMAAQSPELFASFTHAIAFDRKDNCSVITHQARGRCCSDAFATHFGDLLSGDRYTLAPDDGGTYTDTAELIDLIGECTNVSIGYYSQHTPNEILDVEFLLYLRDRVCSLTTDDLAALPTERKPGDPDDSWNRFSQYGWGWDYNSYNTTTPSTHTAPAPKKGKKAAKLTPSAPLDEIDVVNMRWRDLVRWVESAAPEDVADLLTQLAETIVYDMALKGEQE